MADNLVVLDGTGVARTIRTTDNSTVHTPHHTVDSSVLPTGAATQATLASALTTLVSVLAALPGALDASGGLKVANLVALTLTYTDRSGLITLGGTAQVMMSSAAGRKSLFIQNTHATEDLWIRFTGTAAVGGISSIQLRPGDAWQEIGSSVTTQACSVVAATTAHPWTAMEGL